MLYVNLEDGNRKTAKEGYRKVHCQRLAMHENEKKKEGYLDELIVTEVFCELDIIMDGFRWIFEGGRTVIIC